MGSQKAMGVNQEALVRMSRDYPAPSTYTMVDTMRKLARLAQAHDTACIRMCNEADYPESRLESIERRIGALVEASFGGTALYMQRDPRGCTVRLLPPSMHDGRPVNDGIAVLA